jgi:hypothetical protein
MIRIQGIPTVSAALLRAQKGDPINVERIIEGSDRKPETTTSTQDSHLRSEVQAKASAA